MSISYVGYNPTMGGFIPGLGINTANISMPKSTIAASDSVLNGALSQQYQRLLEEQCQHYHG